ncbi:HAD family hydrolase [Streptomyces sp. F63]|uniref:HAD family hydrolase n=1 Tax=Streptomyces sp. F63 TaxID=2824887 RepID=UPI001B37E9F7|nr:HAD family hydrolase [Streptomyces sp. F63]MBQ0983224.1 HAD family hydrolase [Streptomyces sp. F63]
MTTTAQRVRRIALFDLDGTLIRPGSALQRMHMDAMAAAIAHATGRQDAFAYRGAELFYRGVNLAGFTDAGTVRTALRLAGAIEDEIAERLPEVVADMVGRLERSPLPGAGSAAGDLLPGARELLRALAEAGFALGASTGNARAVAAWKLRAAGLSGLLDDGGFGDTATEREDVARAGAASLTPPGSVPAGVLVGDTVRDVTAAHAAGLSCLAVTTGAATARELLAAGAEDVLPGLDGGGALDSVIRLSGPGAVGRSEAHLPLSHART